MPFYLSKKQAAVIGALFVGFLAGGTLLWRQHGAGFLSANLGGAWYGSGWTEIKPRTEALPEREDAGTKNAPAKTEKPAPVVWCDFAAATATPQTRQTKQTKPISSSQADHKADSKANDKALMAPLPPPLCDSSFAARLACFPARQNRWP